MDAPRRSDHEAACGRPGATIAGRRLTLPRGRLLRLLLGVALLPIENAGDGVIEYTNALVERLATAVDRPRFRVDLTEVGVDGAPGGRGDLSKTVEVRLHLPL